MNYIYCYTNIKNNHKYVGQTNNIERRKREHRSCANNEKSKSYNDLFHKKLRDYGEENFSFEILEIIDGTPNDVNQAEIKWIAELHTYAGDHMGGYNLNRGGENNVQWTYDLMADSIIQAIKDGLPYSQISLEYGISPGHITNINQGKYYHRDNETYPLRKYYKTENEIDDIKTLLITTAIPMTEIAQNVGMAYSTIKKINYGTLHHDNKHIYPLRQKKATAQRADKIKELLLEGYSNQEIMLFTGASDETIRRINNGITFKDETLTYPLRSL